MKALLDLLFEGHEIRVVLNGRALFIAIDICAALGISKHRDAVARLDADEKCLVDLREVPSTKLDGTPGGNPRFAAVTQSGLYHLIFASRKPTAKKFRRWVTEEVLPQIAKYGTYLPGATPAERCRALRLRWKQERAELLLSEEEKLTASGLLTIAAFRIEHGIHARDAFAFARTVQYQASSAAVQPRRFFQKSGMRSAWPRELLFLALTTFQPRLALGWPEKGPRP